MGEAVVSVHQLADELGISYQAVKKVLDGSTSAFTAFNNSKAARFLKVSSDWLATGEGPKSIQAHHVAEDRPTYTATPINVIEVLASALTHLKNEDDIDAAATYLHKMARNPTGRWSKLLTELIRDSLPVIVDRGGKRERKVLPERPVQAENDLGKPSFPPVLDQFFSTVTGSRDGALDKPAASTKPKRSRS